MQQLFAFRIGTTVCPCISSCAIRVVSVEVILCTIFSDIGHSPRKQNLDYLLYRVCLSVLWPMSLLGMKKQLLRIVHQRYFEPVGSPKGHYFHQSTNLFCATANMCVYKSIYISMCSYIYIYIYIIYAVSSIWHMFGLVGILAPWDLS